MVVVVNGDEVEVVEGTTVTILIEQLGLGTKWVLVERNGEPVDRADRAATRLEAGDRVELVRAVAGG